MRSSNKLEDIVNESSYNEDEIVQTKSQEKAGVKNAPDQLAGEALIWCVLHTCFCLRLCRRTSSFVIAALVDDILRLGRVVLHLHLEPFPSPGRLLALREMSKLCRLTLLTLNEVNPRTCFGRRAAAQTELDIRNARYRSRTASSRRAAASPPASSDDEDDTPVVERLGMAEKAVGKFVTRRLQPAVERVHPCFCSRQVIACMKAA